MLRAQVDLPSYAARYNDPSGSLDEFFAMPAVPYLKLAENHDDKTGMSTLFALNRSLTEELPLRLTAAGFSRLAVKQALQLCDPDLKAVNTRQNPDRIVPRPLSSQRTEGERVEAVLAPASWNAIQLATSD